MIKYSKETNMEEIKNVAKIYLSFPVKSINGLGFDLLVHHPFTDSSVYFCQKEINGKKELNLFDKDDKKIFDKMIYENIIKDTKKPESILTLITVPYKTAFLNTICSGNYLSEEDMVECLRDVWQSCDYVNIDKNIRKTKYIAYFKSLSKFKLMSKKEMEKYVEMMYSDELVIYRGTNSNTNHPTWKALSWTIDKESARFFAERFLKPNEKGTIAKLILNKEEIHKYVIAYFEDIDESEVILDYRFLTKDFFANNKDRFFLEETTR